MRICLTESMNVIASKLASDNGSLLIFNHESRQSQSYIPCPLRRACDSAENLDSQSDRRTRHIEVLTTQRFQLAIQQLQIGASAYPLPRGSKQVDPCLCAKAAAFRL